MTDLHTHILPAMDDGSRDVEMSLEMLRREQEQGVDNVIFTPHCYRDQERPERFLARRKAAFETLKNAIEAQGCTVPKLYLGAEVAWAPHLADWEELEELCIQGTHNLLLEMPFHPWNDQTIHQIYEMMEKRGVTPVFAHIERYLKHQKREHIEEILSMGTPIQINADTLLQGFMTRRVPLKMLRDHQAHLLASDCHNLTKRPPNLRDGYDLVEKKLGTSEAERLSRNSDRLLYD